jgi:hypothetical protein
VSDFVTELRREVVGAHAAHRRHAGRARRRRLRPALAAGLALAVLLVALLLVVRSLPGPEPSKPRVAKVVQLGGVPVDGVVADDSLWIADGQRSQVVRMDPRSGRVLARIPVRLKPDEIAAGPAGLWVRGSNQRADVTVLAEIDPRAGRIVRPPDTGGADATGGSIAVGDRALWLDRGFLGRIDRIDPRTERITRRIGFGRTDGLALGGRTLWAIGHDGTVAAVDTAAGRIVHRWPQLASANAFDDASEVIAADAGGAWVLGTDAGTIFRLEGDRVTRRLRVPPHAQPLLARTPDGLWIATGDALRNRYRLSRIDPDRGDVTAVVDLGRHRPVGLVPAPDGLWVVGGDGTAVLIDT